MSPANAEKLTWIVPALPLRYCAHTFHTSKLRPTTKWSARPVMHYHGPPTEMAEPEGTSHGATPTGISDWDGKGVNADFMLKNVKFNEAGLVPAIAQQWDSGEILMMAWMSAESIRETMTGGRAVYFSRSRKKLWRKGETSGQIQVLKDVILDCDGDTILLKVDQLGVACHTGRRSCFYTAYRPPNGEGKVVADVLMDPKELYKSAA
eukprot:GFKZ01000386.1.p1 GENE.GFKZ01000386.1~~GFKZ01000386.1.p1  ORF type:complete len:207 (-),score=26.48 GFKZ01000386.1:623-1243(-)